MKKRLEGRLCLLVTILTRTTFLSYLGSGPPSIKNYLCGILKVPARSRVCHRWLMMRKVSQTSSPALGTTGRGVGFAVFNQRGIYQSRGYRRCTSPKSSNVSASRKPRGTLKKSADLVYILFSACRVQIMRDVLHIYITYSHDCVWIIAFWAGKVAAWIIALTTDG